ncbi:MAG TPA: hypothetical protein VMZ27_13485 [Candidatus Saccharimonadales bacterium]|nr:hypothetical protein [Candidatus Saccharimonadales bacterium]
MLSDLEFWIVQHPSSLLQLELGVPGDPTPFEKVAPRELQLNSIEEGVLEATELILD